MYCCQLFSCKPEIHQQACSKEHAEDVHRLQMMGLLSIESALELTCMADLSLA